MVVAVAGRVGCSFGRMRCRARRRCRPCAFCRSSAAVVLVFFFLVEVVLLLDVLVLLAFLFRGPRPAVRFLLVVLLLLPCIGFGLGLGVGVAVSVGLRVLLGFFFVQLVLRGALRGVAIVARTLGLALRSATGTGGARGGGRRHGSSVD